MPLLCFSAASTLTSLTTHFSESLDYEDDDDGGGDADVLMLMPFW